MGQSLCWCQEGSGAQPELSCYLSQANIPVLAAPATLGAVPWLSSTFIVPRSC